MDSLVAELEKRNAELRNTLIRKDCMIEDLIKENENYKKQLSVAKGVIAAFQEKSFNVCSHFSTTSESLKDLMMLTHGCNWEELLKKQVVDQEETTITRRIRKHFQTLEGITEEIENQQVLNDQSEEENIRRSRRQRLNGTPVKKDVRQNGLSPRVLLERLSNEFIDSFRSSQGGEERLSSDSQQPGRSLRKRSNSLSLKEIPINKKMRCWNNQVYIND